MRLNINHINKKDFLSVYYQACTEIYKEKIIYNKFKVTDLILYNLV